MIHLILINILIIMLSFILLYLNFFLSKKKFKYRNKLTSFECGFDNISFMRLPFSINFFMISLIFLIFDIEISLIFPMIKIMKMKFFKIKMFFIMITILLIIGLYYEWKEGSLKWLN
uniref:NADH-ubiquinone oxidoreductase chain 3 n=1 Tax=Saphonecrus sp. ZJUH 20220015 TaxID=2943460 RepID=A0A9E8K075_9HYME|nr:NADH dehydrogenase subunit 3 [Saphonecrus sp. ZJUH 20220015]